jgi:hypothetical protein
MFDRLDRLFRRLYRRLYGKPRPWRRRLFCEPLGDRELPSGLLDLGALTEGSERPGVEAGDRVFVSVLGSDSFDSGEGEDTASDAGGNETHGGFRLRSAAHRTSQPRQDHQGQEGVRQAHDSTRPHVHRPEETTFSGWSPKADHSLPLPSGGKHQHQQPQGSTHR